MHSFILQSLNEVEFDKKNYQGQVCVICRKLHVLNHFKMMIIVLLLFTRNVCSIPFCHPFYRFIGFIKYFASQVCDRAILRH
jgi:hypothetical protein